MGILLQPWNLMWCVSTHLQGRTTVPCQDDPYWPWRHYSDRGTWYVAGLPSSRSPVNDHGHLPSPFAASMAVHPWLWRFKVVPPKGNRHLPWYLHKAPSTWPWVLASTHGIWVWSIYSSHSQQWGRFTLTMEACVSTNQGGPYLWTIPILLLSQTLMYLSTSVQILKWNIPWKVTQYYNSENLHTITWPGGIGRLLFSSYQISPGCLHHSFCPVTSCSFLPLPLWRQTLAGPIKLSFVSLCDHSSLMGYTHTLENRLSSSWCETFNFMLLIYLFPCNHWFPSVNLSLALNTALS